MATSNDNYWSPKRVCFLIACFAAIACNMIIFIYRFTLIRLFDDAIRARINPKIDEDEIAHAQMLLQQVLHGFVPLNAANTIAALLDAVPTHYGTKCMFIMFALAGTLSMGVFALPLVARWSSSTLLAAYDLCHLSILICVINQWIYMTIMLWHIVAERKRYYAFVRRLTTKCKNKNRKPKPKSDGVTVMNKCFRDSDRSSSTDVDQQSIDKIV